MLRLLLLCVVSWNAAALELPIESRIPGGVTILPLTETKLSRLPTAWYKGDRVMVVSSTNTKYANQAPWLAVVGIPLSAAPEKKQHLRADGKSYYFDITGKSYKSQYLTIKNKRHVNPDPADAERWKKERAEMDAAFLSWSKPLQHGLKLELPTTGPFSSPFGLRRFFNNQPRKPHSGLDIAAPKGTPIIAPGAATVVATGDYFFNGKTVILDHGNGMTSLYCHLSEIMVNKGDKLSKGQRLGKVGKTGRVTGAHLHWSISLNNTRVDPMLFLHKQ